MSDVNTFLIIFIQIIQFCHLRYNNLYDIPIHHYNGYTYNSRLHIYPLYIRGATLKMIMYVSNINVSPNLHCCKTKTLLNIT